MLFSDTQHCSPGAIGVCIGGDRTAGYHHAKLLLFRTIDDVNPDPRLAELEGPLELVVYVTPT